MNNEKTTAGPGRPSYQPVFPKHTPFSFRELCMAQGMEFTIREGKHIKKTGECTPLTLRKFMDIKGCPIIQVQGLFAEPLGKKGMGRKSFMLALKDGFIPTKTVSVAKVSVPVSIENAPAIKTKKVKVVKTKEAKTKRKYTRKDTIDTSSVDIGNGFTKSTQTYEDIKSILAIPTPELTPDSDTPAIIIPVIDIAPATPSAIPAPVAVDIVNSNIVMEEPANVAS